MFFITSVLIQLDGHGGPAPMHICKGHLRNTQQMFENKHHTISVHNIQVQRSLSFPLGIPLYVHIRASANHQ